ncbi:MAG: cupin domain-containing protein [Psychromonas sp.]
MTHQIRRVVTGLDNKGHAICISDEIATNILQRSTRPGVTLTNLWQTQTSPAEFNGPEETVDGPFVLHPPEKGTVFRIIEFLPEDPEVIKNIDGKAAFAAMGAAQNIVDNARHPYMHRTDSVDYAVILKGQIWMLMDRKEDDVLLKTGDTVVQRGTNHAWSNRGTEPCLMMFVLVDGISKSKR